MSGHRKKSLSPPLFAVLCCAVFGGCTGPSNPEPILMHPQEMSVTETAPDTVSFEGGAGAIENAVTVEILNLDQQILEGALVDESGIFNVILTGMPMDRYRLTAFDAAGRWEALVLTAGPVPGEVVEIAPAEQGCLRIGPTHLNLGSSSAGEPLYGQVTVSSTCAAPTVVLSVSIDNPRFTPVTLLLDEPLQPGTDAVVSITYLAPGGLDEAFLVVEPELPPPEQLPLVVTLRAESVP